MTIRVVDASVIVKLFVEEPDSDTAELLVLEGHELVAPELLLLEVTNALHRKLTGGEIRQDDVLSAVDRMQRSLLALHPTGPQMQRAAEIAIEIDHPVYDCLYLALAERLHAPLVTADRRFHDRAAVAGYGERVFTLG